MIGRLLDSSYGPVVRREITALTVARLAANGCYRYTPPFIAVVARGLDVRLSELGAAIAITELVGLTSPFIGRHVDRISRRFAAILGLSGVIAGTMVVALSANIVMFAAGLILLAAAKITYDVALGAWIADHVPYERRGRVVGLTETSWALGLLAGVASMGAVAAMTNWRWGYVTGALYVTLTLVFVTARVGRTATTTAQAATTGQPATPRPHADDTWPAAPPARLDPAAWWLLVGAFGLMGAVQAVFVTFGAWLEDDFGFTVGALAAVTFGIGALELVASMLSAARTDRWGKERSVILGAGVMIPTGVLLGLVNFNVAVGLVLLCVYIAAFEFAIVSSFPIASRLIPDAPARGLGALIAGGTLARSLVALPATWLYEQFGIRGSVTLGCTLALVAVAGVGRRVQLVGWVTASAESGPV